MEQAAKLEFFSAREEAIKIRKLMNPIWNFKIRIVNFYIRPRDEKKIPRYKDWQIKQLIIH